ncbi:MAG TPA: prepilin-type N-terminal cleavage/methylation domain-containing protein [Gemmatimonadaceae bacterium]|nr:prepilin-type N-terminal cleavage/methylation domain-containing protein [Gemmatimonadaceae bacterium]
MTLRPRAAFTLIELLIVVVVIGILVAILIPSFKNTKGRANEAALKSDLRNIAVAQEAYFFDHAAYANDVAMLNAHTSPGVIITLATPGPGSWVATAMHPASYPLKCTLFYGPVTPPPPPATAEGVLTCK